jgi:hypothetical protein
MGYSKTEYTYVSQEQADEWNHELDEMIRRELFEAKCEPQGDIDMVRLWELYEDMRFEGKEGHKAGWRFEDEDIGFEQGFATKAAAKARIREWRNWLKSLYAK